MSRGHVSGGMQPRSASRTGDCSATQIAITTTFTGSAQGGTRGLGIVQPTVISNYIIFAGYETNPRHDQKPFRSWRFRIPTRSTALGDNSRSWTNGEIAKLKRMAGRIPRDQIAAKLGRTPAATAMEASKLGISLSLQSDIRRALRNKATKKRPRG
jgi:hypothetical protein